MLATGKCSKHCVQSKAFEFVQHVNSTDFTHFHSSVPAACVTCENRATIVCATCYCTAYCTKVCLLEDYERHQWECRLHSKRLWLCRQLELYSTQSVRIKHTGDATMGVGMFARQAFVPGQRVLEDGVYLTWDTIKQLADNYEKAAPFHRAAVFAFGQDEDDGGQRKFTVHSSQITGMTRGYLGYWTIFINHSCSPNCVLMVSTCKTYVLVTAIRPIAKGEEITIAYHAAACAPKEHRAPVLKALLGVDCACAVCAGDWQASEGHRFVVWDAIQFSRQSISRILCIDKDTTSRMACDIGRMVVNIGRELLGTGLYADPWLAIVVSSALEYLELAYDRFRTKELRDAVNAMKKETSDVLNMVGLCLRLLVRE